MISKKKEERNWTLRASLKVNLKGRTNLALYFVPHRVESAQLGYCILSVEVLGGAMCQVTNLGGSIVLDRGAQLR